MFYVPLNGRWCDIIVLYDKKNSFYEEPERVFNQLQKHRMKTLLGAFNEKVVSIFSNQQSRMKI
jgi:hypothetical protein